MSADFFALHDDWSDLKARQAMPEIDFEILHNYRRRRLREALVKADAAMVVLVNPINLRYAAEYRSYALFQSHIPTTYLFFPPEGPLVMHGLYGPTPHIDEVRPARALAPFDGGGDMEDASAALAQDVLRYLSELGTDNRRVAVDYVNPSVTLALKRQGLDPIDGAPIAEMARLIKSDEEIACMKWAVAVAELGITKMAEVLRPGVSEQQLWGLLNYANLANDGDWHDGRMLASGPRTNPWLQEASPRRICPGDLVGFDTDMVGPFGYFADISRTLHCGPDKPTRRQKQLYRLALDEVEHNLTLVRAGVSFEDFRQKAYTVPEEFHEQAYVCIAHGVGMCDEYPKITPRFRGDGLYDGTMQAGMVLCIESYMGAVGETDGVKLEEQVLVTETGYEKLTRYPFEERLLD